MRSKGYVVDVYTGVNATLDPLEDLGEYDLIILRAHGAYNGDPETGRPLGTYIYTGLHYDEAVDLYGERKIDDMVRDGLLALAVIPPPGWNGSLEGLPRYVAVSPAFIEKYYHPQRQGAIVIYTGCYGLTDYRLAEAFIGRGASAFIAWNGNVTWTAADNALIKTLEALLSGAQPQDVPSLLGHDSVDPVTGSRLSAYVRVSG